MFPPPTWDVISRITSRTCSSKNTSRRKCILAPIETRTIMAAALRTATAVNHTKDTSSFAQICSSTETGSVMAR